MKGQFVLIAALVLASMVITCPARMHAQQAQDCANESGVKSACQSWVIFSSQPTPPQDCCDAVNAADLPCMCNKYKNQEGPASVRQRVMSMPKACGNPNFNCS